MWTGASPPSTSPGLPPAIYRTARTHGAVVVEVVVLGQVAGLGHAVKGAGRVRAHVHAVLEDQLVLLQRDAAAKPERDAVEEQQRRAVGDDRQQPGRRGAQEAHDPHRLPGRALLRERARLGDAPPLLPHAQPARQELHHAHDLALHGAGRVGQQREGAFQREWLLTMNPPSSPRQV